MMRVTRDETFRLNIDPARVLDRASYNVHTYLRTIRESFVRDSWESSR